MEELLARMRITITLRGLKLIKSKELDSIEIILRSKEKNLFEFHRLQWISNFSERFFRGSKKC